MKKQARKLLAMFVCLVLAVGLLPVSALAMNRATFTADDVKAKAGESVQININLIENQGIAAGKVTLSCDQVTVEKIETGDRDVYKSYVKGADGSYRGEHGGFAVNASAGICNWWETTEYNDTGIYAVYTLRIKDDVEPGTYAITVTAEDLAGVQINEDGEEVVVSYRDGEYAYSQTFTATLTVTDGEPEPVEKKHRAIFTADDVTAKAGETVDINVNITENMGIAAGLVTLSCDQFVIDKISRGDWTPVLNPNLPDYAANKNNGKYNWYQGEESSREGVYAVYTVTVGDDVEPGTYDIVLVAEDLAGVQSDEYGEEIVVSYKDGEYFYDQTYIATLTVLGDEPEPTADIVADTVTATCGEGETADVDISYVGEDEITSVRFVIDSVIPVDSISSDYKFEYNDEIGMIIVWAEDGAAFGESVIATLHYDLDVSPWYSDAEYPIYITLVEATDKDGEITELTADSGALIIENVYKPGDVNMDGTVDNRDVIMIARYLVELLEFNDRQMEIADFNDDDKVNNTDLVLVCQYIVE